MKTIRCDCPWCRPVRVSTVHDDAEDLALDAASLSGPFDYSDTPHALALTLKAALTRIRELEAELGADRLDPDKGAG